MKLLLKLIWCIAWIFISANALADSLHGVYRFYNTTSGSHFYTINEAEKNALASNPSFRDEGIAFYAHSERSENLMAVFRFYNTATNSHFYTINASERDFIVSSYKDFRYEGIAWYASKAALPGTTPLYRFFRSPNNVHFYTLNEGEKNNITATLPDFRYENIAYFVWPSPVPAAIPAWEYRSSAYILQQNSQLFSLAENLANFQDWLKAYRSLGMNSVTLIAWIPIDPKNGSVKSTYENRPWPNTDPNAKTPDYFTSFTQAAKQSGMKVIWKPQFVLDDNTNNNVSDWALGKLFYPNGTNFNVDHFLEEVNAFWKTWSAAAALADVDLLIIGTEHGSYAAAPYTAKWRQIIATTRSAYGGKITYAENHFEPFQGAVNVEFWDALDYIGIDDYIPIGNGTANTPYDSAYNSVFESSLGFSDKAPTNNLPDILCKLHRTYNKPILFTEFGIQSRDGAMNHPPFVEGKTNLTEQEYYFRVNFDVWTNFPWVVGLSFWNQENEWSTGPSKPNYPSYFDSYVIDGYEFFNKPAGNVLKDYWVTVKLPPAIPDKYRTACM